MIRRFMLLVLLTGLGCGVLPAPAQAQQCPGVGGWVFDDVPADDPFCGAITWMAQQGVTLGCTTIDGGHRLYCPDTNVSRRQMAALMQRLAESLFPLDCTAGQAMRWNGGDWVCANDPPGVPGPQGPAGPQGQTGAAGPQGAAGAAGPQGPAGAVGAQGPTGAQGPEGAQGAVGATGAQGPAGTNGRTLLSGAGTPAPAAGEDGDFYIDTDADAIYGPKAAGAWGAATSLVGPSGPAGATGATGATGPAGAQGATGATGAQGPQGDPGPVGATGATGATGTQGPAGPQGPTGATGAQGPQGEPGPVGATGATGATGAQGPAGPAGPTGAQGPQGDPGPTGATGAAGTTGPQGPIGPQGPEGPVGPAGSSITPIVTTTLAEYKVLSTDHTVFCDVTLFEPVTVTLPSAAANPGKIFVVRRVGGGNNQCNVTPVIGVTLPLDNAGQPRAVQVQSDGANWWPIASTTH